MIYVIVFLKVFSDDLLGLLPGFFPNSSIIY